MPQSRRRRRFTDRTPALSWELRRDIPGEVWRSGDYEVFQRGAEWCFSHDGEISPDGHLYASAFDAKIAASNYNRRLFGG